MRSLEAAIELLCKKVSNLEKIFETYLWRRYSQNIHEGKINMKDFFRLNYLFFIL